MQQTTAKTTNKRKFKLYPLHYTVTASGFFGSVLALDMNAGMWTAAIFSILAGGLGAYLHTIAIKPDFIWKKGMIGLWSVLFLHSWRLAPFSLAGGGLAWFVFA